MHLSTALAVYNTVAVRLRGLFITSSINGILYIHNIFDFDVADSGALSFFIPAICLDLDFGGITFSNPAFSLIVNTHEMYSLSWDGMYVEVGGEKKLDLRL